MSKKVVILIMLISLLSLFGCRETTEPTPVEEYDKSTNLYINFSQNSMEISEGIYGTFIEHIGTCIYNGIWSEIILDRKFHDRVGEGVSQWLYNGDVLTHTEKTMGDQYSILLNEGGEIYQRGLSLDENKEYDGYFYAIGTGRIKITIENTESLIEKTISVDSTDFEKYTYSFQSLNRNKKNKITFKALEGSIIIDSVSLMPSDNYHGMRRDTLDQLRKLNASFYRWPGGNFVSGYDWKDGIGDRDYRVTKRNQHYSGLESDFATPGDLLANDIMKIGSLGFYGAFDSNDYGIDEFIIMCRYLNAEPNIVVNSGLGSVQDAADQVEYCNTNGTTYGNRRPTTEPYNISLWTIGNEMNGYWQLGNVPIGQYIVRHNEFYTAMKAVDPTIKIFGVGDNYSNWSKLMLENCEMDYISEHFYGERDENNPWRHIRSLQGQAEMRVGLHREIETSALISFDEYAYENAECPSRLKDGMGVALALNTFMRNADVVKYACYSSTVNATQGSITTDNFNAYMQGNGYALMLYRNNLFNTLVKSSFKLSGLDMNFDIVVTVNDDKTQIAIAVVNSSEDRIKINCTDFGKVVSKKWVTAETLEDFNKEEREYFEYYEEGNLNEVIVEPRSISVFIINIKK